MKSALWFFSKIAGEIAAKHPEEIDPMSKEQTFTCINAEMFFVRSSSCSLPLKDSNLKLISMVHYKVYVAFYIMDHCDLILSDAEATDPCHNLVSNYANKTCPKNSLICQWHGGHLEALFIGDTNLVSAP